MQSKKEVSTRKETWPVAPAIIFLTVGVTRPQSPHEPSDTIATSRHHLTVRYYEYVCIISCMSMSFECLCLCLCLCLTLCKYLCLCLLLCVCLRLLLCLCLCVFLYLCLCVITFWHVGSMWHRKSRQKRFPLQLGKSIPIMEIKATFIINLLIPYFGWSND